MKLTWLTLSAFLALGITGAHGSNLLAGLSSIGSRSNIEVIGDSYKGSVAVTAFLAAGVRSVSRTAPTNLLRSMWGQ